MQQLLLSKEDLLPERQEWNQSLDQNDSEPPKIKEEQEELWSEDEEKPQSSQLHQRQKHQSAEVELLTRKLTEPRTLKIEANGEDCSGSQPASNSGPHTIDMQTLPTKEEILPEQQEKNWSVDREDIKEKQEKLWISLQVLESQSNESPAAEPVASSSPVHGTLTAEADGEDDGRPQSGSYWCLQPDTNSKSSDCSEIDSYKRKQTKKFKSGFNNLINGKVSLSYSKFNMNEKKYNHSEYGKSRGHTSYLKQQKRRQGSEKPLSCSECGQRFGHKNSLVRHMRIHTGQKPFSCSECGTTFGHKSSLIRHMTMHTGQKPFSCSECGQRFWRDSSLTTHMRIHTGQKLFSCSECGKRFGEKAHLTAHMRIHTGQKPFSCSECGAIFGYENSLNRHMRMHTGQKPFSCSECGKRFWRESCRITHMRIHTGQKPFSCSECGTIFGYESSLNRHMRVHTGQGKDHEIPRPEK
ncbi:gastrula zinc finger protein XlCGF57.1-like [Thalassophryne amazonica]|uniref:gastrula zinc finger protein XlCGF57.1-like n=1 Tax=Thalassophryne amazonica TaxID=390379 RepID=UPI001471770E|nr:gastrula zinc finger protein XlCGF57.1-like [Thalassophryne amazonica]